MVCQNLPNISNISRELIPSPNHSTFLSTKKHMDFHISDVSTTPVPSTSVTWASTFWTRCLSSFVRIPKSNVLQALLESLPTPQKSKHSRNIGHVGSPMPQLPEFMSTVLLRENDHWLFTFLLVTSNFISISCMHIHTHIYVYIYTYVMCVCIFKFNNHHYV